MNTIEQQIADEIRSLIPNIKLRQPDFVTGWPCRKQIWKNVVIIPYDASRPRDEIYNVFLTVAKKGNRFEVDVDDSDGQQSGLFVERLVAAAIDSLT